MTEETWIHWRDIDNHFARMRTRIEQLETALRGIAGPPPVYFDNGEISWLKLCAMYRKIANEALEMGNDR